jgi:hypothetical protein
MYAYRNIEALSFSHCCSGKGMSITQHVCVFVALGIQYAMRMRRVAICDPHRSTVFFHILPKRNQFSTKLLYLKCVFRFSPQLLSETFLIQRRTERRYGQKCILVFMKITCYSCEILMKLEFSRQLFEKKNYSVIKFFENPSSESRVVDGRTDMTKLIVAFRNFANASPKNAYCGMYLCFLNFCNKGDW